jgi:hypothetical protein
MAQKEIVYFVGAGLSKSLERLGKLIPLMYDFVSVMADYAPDDPVILTTLAELENAGVFAWPAQEAHDLAKRVVGSDADRSRETVGRFRDAMKRRPAESIEDLLLRASSEGERQRSPDSDELRVSASVHAPDRFRYAVSRLFSVWIGWDVDWCPVERFLSHQFKSYPLETCKHTFVSFNYDLLLDRAIQRIAHDAHHAGHPSWQPSTGYGFDISWYLESNEAGLPPSQASVSTGKISGGFTQYPEAKLLPSMPSVKISILKPHGSLNWVVCHDKGHKMGVSGLLVDPNTPVFLPLTDAEHLDYWRAQRAECQNIIYNPPRLGNRFGEAHASIFLVPPTPTAKKTKPVFLTRVHEAEAAAITNAEEIFIIGWSMPATDQDQTCTIRSCVAKREKPLDSITVINHGERSEYFERIAGTFRTPPSSLRVFNNGFSDYVEHVVDGAR